MIISETLTAETTFQFMMPILVALFSIIDQKTVAKRHGKVSHFESSPSPPQSYIFCKLSKMVVEVVPTP